MVVGAVRGALPWPFGSIYANRGGLVTRAKSDRPQHLRQTGTMEAIDSFISAYLSLIDRTKGQHVEMWYAEEKCEIGVSQIARMESSSL